MDTKTGVITIILILAAIVFSYGYVNHLFSISGTASCNAAVTNLQCGQQVNGVVTSLSQVTLASNYGPLNCKSCWLANFVLNGGGQYLFGATAQQIASQFNSSSSVKNNYAINIQAKLNYQKLVIPYTYSGTSLNLLKSEPIVFNFGWFTNGAGLLTSCYQTNQTASNPSYTVGCTGQASNSDYLSVLQAYSNECSSGGGYAFLVASGAATIGGVTMGNAYQIDCLAVTSGTAGLVYSPGSPKISENLSIIYSNSTNTHTFYLTSASPQASYSNQLYAQIWGYSVGSLNTYIGTTSPTLIVEPSGTSLALPNIPISTIESLDTFQISSLQSAGLNFNNVPISNIYNPQPFLSGIGQQNTQVNNLLSSPLQGSSPFANIQILGYGGEGRYIDAFTGAPYEGIVDVTSNPVYYPEIQLISNAASLGITIPIAYPKIFSVSPNPIVIQSGAQATATFMISNNATVSGSAYIIINAQNGTQIAETQDFSIPAQGTAQESVQIPAYDPYLANLNTNFIATIRSAQMTSIYSSFSFPVVIKPNCALGSTYINNTSCQSTTSTCVSGYAWNGTGCHPICSSPSIFNATTQSCYVPLRTNISIGEGWYIFAAIIVVVIIYLLYRSRYKNKKHGR